MDRLTDLLFELSSTERMNIMHELQRQRSKLSTLSKKLGITNPEASRHLRRLGESSLIQKDADGLYELTPFGTLVLSQLSGLDFMAKHREYFLQCDTSYLPYEFISRIGELAEGKIFAETFRTIEETARRFKEAEEFVWIISDQNLTILAPVLAEKLNVSFDLKIIFPEDAYYPDSIAPIPSTMPGVQKRVLPKVEVRVVITEKHAGFSLPLRSSRLDYRAFIGNDPKFKKWCSDLFLYYWDKAKPFVSK